MADTAAEVRDDPRTIAGQWLSEITTAQRMGKLAEWHRRGDQVVRRYKDERDDQRDGLTFRRQRMNLLWANVETLKPALYAHTPKPNVSRRNKDKDPLALWAGVVLERCLAYTLGYQDFDHTMRLCLSDYLLPGRGIAWEVYEPQYGQDEEGAERVEWETTRTKYIHWKDFCTNAARTWDEVWWAGHKAYQSREELLKLLLSLGVDRKKAVNISTNIRLDHVADQKPKQDQTPDDDRNRKATVWCIWDKPRKEVIYVSPGWTDEPLHIGPPPLAFDNFWPFPRPITATTATDTIIPVPDFAMYQDQADEIDELTQRIYLLSRALKVVGLYNASIPSIAQLLNDATDNTMIPVDQWAMFAERGGLQGAVDFFPIDAVVKTMTECVKAREICKQALYEITGISDIVRGATDAGETATAQQIKSQWGSLRIRDRQQDVQRFARDIIRIKAEVICETFADETIKKMSGVKLLTKAEKMIGQQRAQTDPQMAEQFAQANPEVARLMNEPTWDEVLGLLRSEKTRGFAIDIEADSTIEPDMMAERQAASEFLAAVGGFLQTSGPMVQQMPALAPLVGELLMFGVRRFKVGETLETTIESVMQQVQQALEQQGQAPDPEKAKIEAQSQLDQQNAKAKADLSMADMNAKAQLADKEAGNAAQLEAMKRQNAFDIENHKANLQAQAHERETNAQRETQSMKASLDRDNSRAAAEDEKRFKYDELEVRELETMRADGPIMKTLAQQQEATAQTQAEVADKMQQIIEALGQLAQGLEGDRQQRQGIIQDVMKRRQMREGGGRMQ
jgi:hypothetical protein